MVTSYSHNTKKKKGITTCIPQNERRGKKISKPVPVSRFVGAGGHSKEKRGAKGEGGGGKAWTPLAR